METISWKLLGHFSPTSLVSDGAHRESSSAAEGQVRDCAAELRKWVRAGAAPNSSRNIRFRWRRCHLGCCALLQPSDIAARPDDSVTTRFLQGFLVLRQRSVVIILGALLTWVICSRARCPTKMQHMLAILLFLRCSNLHQPLIGVSGSIAIAGLCGFQAFWWGAHPQHPPSSCNGAVYRQGRGSAWDSSASSCTHQLTPRWSP